MKKEFSIALLFIICNTFPPRQSAAIQRMKEQHHEQKSAHEEDQLLKVLQFPHELEQLVKSYCFKPELDFFPCVYQAIPIYYRHMNVICSAAVSSKGNTIVSGSYDGTIKIWDNTTDDVCDKLLGINSYSVQSVAISADGALAASGSRDYMVKLWDTRAHACITTLPKNHSPINAIVISHDKNTLVYASNQTIKIWNIATSTHITDMCHRNFIATLAITADGTILSGGWDGTIKIWDKTYTKQYEDAQVSVNVADDLWYINSVATSADGKIIACAAEEAFGKHQAAIRVWDVTTQQMATIADHPHISSSSVAITADGRVIVFGTTKGTVHIWDRLSQKQIALLPNHTDRVTGVAITPDGKTIVSNSEGPLVSIWQCQPLLVSYFSMLPYQKLHHLKCFLDIMQAHDKEMLSRIDELKNIKDFAKHAKIMHNMLDSLPQEIKSNIAHYFNKSNIQELVQAWLKKVFEYQK